MASNILHRRLYVGVLSTGLLAGVLIPLTNASAASCASWVDDKGDATTRQTGVAVLGDAQLDIVSAAFGTVGKNVVGTITTDGLGSSSSDAGDEFRFRFTIAEQDVIFYVDRTAPLGEEIDVTAGFYNFTAETSGDATAEFDVKAKTVRLTGPIEQLAAAVGKPVAGLPVTDLRAETYNQTLFGTITPAKYDEAPTPAKPVIGTVCTMSGAPAAAPTGGATAAPSPTSSGGGGASASPTAEPSASGSAEPSESAAPSATPTPTGPPPAPQPTVPVPAPGCFGFEDPKGDGRPGGSTSPGNDPHLDILSVTGRTTPTALAGHLRLDKLGTRPSFPAFNGHRFEYQFTVADKVVLLRATAEGEGAGLVDGVAAPDLKVTAAFDVVSSQVVLSVDRASLATVLKREIPDGTFLNSQVGRSTARTATPVAFGADTATTDDAARARYTVGDNTCFAPKLSVSLPGRVQTSDRSLVSVAMTTSDGRVAAGQVVTARVGDGRAVSGRTDKQGTVNLEVPVTDAAGLRQLVVRSRGSAGEGEMSSALNVVVERTLLSVRSTGTGSARTLTATLTDDDNPRRALANQRIVFTVAGRSTAVVTDANGRAAAQVPAGSTVDVSYAGRRGFLSPAKVRGTAR